MGQQTPEQRQLRLLCALPNRDHGPAWSGYVLARCLIVYQRGDGLLGSAWCSEGDTYLPDAVLPARPPVLA